MFFSLIQYLLAGIGKECVSNTFSQNAGCKCTCVKGLWGKVWRNGVEECVSGGTSGLSYPFLSWLIRHIISPSLFSETFYVYTN